MPRFDIDIDKSMVDGLSFPERLARRLYALLRVRNPSWTGQQVCQAMGYAPLTASNVWSLYNSDTWTQNLINELSKEMNNLEITPENIKASLMREAQRVDNRSSQAARVSALSALARIEGLDKGHDNSEEKLPEDMSLAELARAVREELERRKANGADNVGEEDMRDGRIGHA